MFINFYWPIVCAQLVILHYLYFFSALNTDFWAFFFFFIVLQFSDFTAINSCLNSRLMSLILHESEVKQMQEFGILTMKDVEYALFPCMFLWIEISV